mmetsp:Transcript_36006/g.47657  ORF Transcript_36006/g.47657 Transcript_36006/m.47657 type:complete len:266 (+) Transcript_36006:92-889(+)
MEAPVTISEIIAAELQLLSGVHFDLMCFHPYKTVLSYTNDLRSFLKSERGRALATFPGEDEQQHQQPQQKKRPIVGEDLRPMHDDARRIVDDAVVSDIPLLYSPGKIGLAAMMVANENLQKRIKSERGENDSIAGDGDSEKSKRHVIPTIDLLGYVRVRFENYPPEDVSKLLGQINVLCEMLRGLKEGQYNCGNHGVELDKVKVVHKKLKKCKAWGITKKSGGGDSAGGKKKKKKKKRKAEDASDGNIGEGNSDVPPKAKVPKME